MFSKIPRDPAVVAVLRWSCRPCISPAREVPQVAQDGRRTFILHSRHSQCTQEGRRMVVSGRSALVSAGQRFVTIVQKTNRIIFRIDPADHIYIYI